MDSSGCNNTIKLILGDCRERLRDIETGSIDAVVSDPPYEIGFASKSWDSSGIAYSQEVWSECLRVLKPGGILKAFSATRTYHRMVKAIREAGFEGLEILAWAYGSGFPKSHNVSVYMDRIILEGKSREVLRKGIGNLNGNFTSGYVSQASKHDIKTDLAKAWVGYGNALKPAWEPIVCAKKPD